jgi:hypothetical protein
MRKTSKRGTRFRRSLLPAFQDGPGGDDPQDAVHFELMSIALSVARLRQLIAAEAAAIVSYQSRRALRKRT